MKKYLSFLVITFVIGLAGFNINSASAANCAGGDVFNSTTGKLCSDSTIVMCNTGDLFSSVTGQACTTFTNTGTNTTPTTTNSDLKIGARGDAVKTFQQTLINAGFTVKADGVYGPKTDRAAKNYYVKFPDQKPPITPPTTPPTPCPSDGRGVMCPAPTPAPEPCPLTVDSTGAITHTCPTPTPPPCPAGTTPIGMTASMPPHYICGPMTTSALKVISPNGGEVWAKGTTQRITWIDSAVTVNCGTGAGCVGGNSYDINLSIYQAPCTSRICPKYMTPAPRSIAKGVTGSSYNWSIPNCTATNPCSSNFEIPDGQYTIEVCKTGGICDASDSYFTIGSSVTPPITKSVLSIRTSVDSIKVGATTKFQAIYDNCPAGSQCFVGPMAVAATWTSSNPNIASITFNSSCPTGVYCLDKQVDYVNPVITGVSEGTATITATYNGYSANTTIRVSNGGTSIACEYANPPTGYHYEGGQPYPTCGAYLVSDGTSSGDRVLGAETAFHFTQNLKMGSTGAEVTELQKFLNNAGYDCGVADGNFGSKTETSVIKFQTANNLTADGVIGPMVRAVLNK